MDNLDSKINELISIRNYLQVIINSTYGVNPINKNVDIYKKYIALNKKINRLKKLNEIITI